MALYCPSWGAAGPWKSAAALSSSVDPGHNLWLHSAFATPPHSDRPVSSIGQAFGLGSHPVQLRRFGLGTALIANMCQEQGPSASLSSTTTSSSTLKRQSKPKHLQASRSSLKDYATGFPDIPSVESAGRRPYHCGSANQSAPISSDPRVCRPRRPAYLELEKYSGGVAGTQT